MGFFCPDLSFSALHRRLYGPLTEFHELPTPLLRQALKHLSSQGKAQMFAGTEAEDGEGVKFV